SHSARTRPCDHAHRQGLAAEFRRAARARAWLSGRRELRGDHQNIYRRRAMKKTKPLVDAAELPPQPDPDELLDAAIAYTFPASDPIAVDSASRHQDFSARQLDLFPHAPLVLVARVRRLDEIGAGAHAEDQVDDVLQRDVAGMRSGPASPADVVAHAILGDALQGMVERLDVQRDPAAIVVE